MNRADRAKQFLPFNALRGYYSLIEEKERIIEKKKSLSEDELDRLEIEFSKIKVGIIIKVKVYCDDHYEEVEGMVSKINLFERKIRIVKRDILIDDIIDIKL